MGQAFQDAWVVGWVLVGYVFGALAVAAVLLIAAAAVILTARWALLAAAGVRLSWAAWRLTRQYSKETDAAS